jgi:hypothetical protein
LNSLYEQLGGTYRREGDYLIPDLVPPPSPHIGIWGERRRQYLLKNREPIYTAMLLSGKLNAHLEEVDRRAEEVLFHLVDQMARAEAVTEQLKAKDQMAWVGAMNNIRARAEEMVYAELIYN